MNEKTMSTVTLSFSAESTKALHEKIRAYVQSLKPTQAAEAIEAVQEEPKKKKRSVTKKAEKKADEKKPEASTDSTPDTEPSKTGEKAVPTETVGQEEPEVSLTANLHPNATKEDVQAAMKKAMTKQRRDAILTAFGRFNAEKLSDLKEEHYGKFITDLETLVGE